MCIADVKSVVRFVMSHMLLICVKLDSLIDKQKIPQDKRTVPQKRMSNSTLYDNLINSILSKLKSSLNIIFVGSAEQSLNRFQIFKH